MSQKLLLRAFGKAAMSMPGKPVRLTKEEQAALDLALYGQRLDGKAPWPEGPKARRRKHRRS
jgi:hypothetical protein